MAEITKKIIKILNIGDNNELIDGTNCVCRYRDSTSSQNDHEPGKHLTSIEIKIMIK